MSTFKKEIVDKVLVELEYQREYFGKKSVDLAAVLGINRTTLSKLRKFDEYHNQINAEKMQEVLAKLLDMRKQTRIQKSEQDSLFQYTEHSIQSLKGNYLSCTYYEQRMAWRDVAIDYVPSDDIFVVEFLETKQIYRGNYRILGSILYLDVENEVLRDKILLAIYLGSVAFLANNKEVFTGMVTRTSIDGQEIISQKMLLIRKNEDGEFQFLQPDAREGESHTKIWEKDEVKKVVQQAMGWHKNNFQKSPPVENFLFSNLQRLNSNWQQEQLISHFAGLYESWYCSPSQEQDARSSIKKARLKIRKDGTVRLKTPYQEYKGFATLLLETDVLEISASGGEFNDESRRNGGLSMTFSLGGSWRREKPDIQHLHGVSSSVYTDGGPIVMREVLIKVPDNEEVEIEDIPIGGEKYWKILNESNGQKRDLILFLTGQTENYIKTFRSPDKEFRRWEDYGLLYFTSALYWAGKGEYKECLKNLGLAFSHGFNEIGAIEYELTEGVLNQPTIKENVKKRQVNGTFYYVLENFYPIIKETTWQYFRKDLMERWRNSFPK